MIQSSDSRSQSDVLANWQEVQSRIAATCARSGRTPEQITLLGAAKTVAPARLQQFIDAGLLHLGANYVQEGIAQKAALGEMLNNNTALHWHLIGALQSNKAKVAVHEFSLIHSVDRPSLAESLDKAAREYGKVQDALLQVNIGNENSKAGCAVENLPSLAEFCAAMENLRVCGLMCLPPYDEDAEKTRPYFQQMRLLREQLTARNLLQDNVLSMGMTNNFEVAIEEGTTLIRLGTALFGARAKHFAK